MNFNILYQAYIVPTFEILFAVNVILVYTSGIIAIACAKVAEERKRYCKLEYVTNEDREEYLRHVNYFDRMWLPVEEWKVLQGAYSSWKYRDGKTPFKTWLKIQERKHPGYIQRVIDDAALKYKDR